jgi:hypothetical protein
MKRYKVVARLALLYGSETWVTTKRDVTHLESAEMRLLRSVKGYTRLDKIRTESIRNEPEIPGIQEVITKHKQNWINHLERMDNTRLPKHALHYQPRGRRDRGHPRNDGNASLPEQVKRPKPWEMMMLTTTTIIIIIIMIITIIKKLLGRLTPILLITTGHVQTATH